MAGDWIKMRTGLKSHPKIVRISSALKADRLKTIGGLYAVWSLFDAHSIDGIMEGYTPEFLDDEISWPGFSAEMIKIGWLIDHVGSLETPRFDEHNGQSAKRRAQETERKRLERLAAESENSLSASDADKSKTESGLEKRREEKRVNLTTSNEVVVGNEVANACPHQEIIAIYHETLAVGTRIRVWNGTRMKHLQARWREDAKRQRLDWWKRFFEYVAESEFLTGRAPAAHGRDPFVVSLDWLVNPQNFAKVIEGRYNREMA